MRLLATAIVVLSTAITFTVILAAIAWIVASLVSQSLARGIFIGGWTIAVTALSAWLGVRLATPLVRRNREYMEQVRRKRNRV